MRPPRFRFTVRPMMVVVAFIALALVVAQEFRDGFPPRFVVRGIPARIGRLRSGMTPQQADEVLGLRKSWLLGGLGARPVGGWGNGRSRGMGYEVRPSRLVYEPASVGGGPVQATGFYRSTAMIQLVFASGFREKAPARLISATYSNDGRVLAEMPRLPTPAESAPRPDPDRSAPR